MKRVCCVVLLCNVCCDACGNDSPVAFLYSLLQHELTPILTFLSKSNVQRAPTVRPKV